MKSTRLFPVLFALVISGAQVGAQRPASELDCASPRAVEASSGASALAMDDTSFHPASDGVFTSSRRDQGFVAHVTARGIRFECESDQGQAAWRLELATESIGRDGAPRVARNTAPSARSHAVEIERGVALEWFEPHQRGIEQSWTIASRPPGGAAQESLVVRVALDTDLLPRLTSDREAIYFHDSSGRPVLRYGELAAFDANGRELEATLALALGAIEVRVDDHDAAYPIVVDPLTSSAAWSTESNQAGAFMGYGISTAGDVNGDGFSDLVVGAPRFDSNTLTDNGAVSVYFGSPSGLSATADWSISGDQGGAQLGVAVATAGDVNADGFDDFVVGELFYDGGVTDEGRCHLFLGSAAGPVATAWKPEGNQSGCQLGYSVGWAGDVNGDGYDDVIVGAPYYDAGQTDEGRAFVFLGLPSGLSTSPIWIVESNQASALFGFAVAGAGDLNADGYDDVIVGAPYYNNGASADAGAASVYLGGQFGPSTTPVYFGTVSQASVNTGYSVGPAGDVNGDGYADVMFGGPYYDNGQTNEGLVWVKTGSSTGITGAGWSEEGDIASIGWGYSASTAGDVNGDGYADIVSSGVYWENSGSTLDEGAVWLYLGSKTGLGAGSSQLVGQGNQTNAYFGHRVGAAGDVNGDGFSDVYVATAYFDNSEVDEGKVWIHYGFADTVASTPQWTVEPNFTSANYGEVVSMAGDVDGDGFDDLLVASGSYPNVFAQGGRVYLYAGRESPIATAASWFIDAAQVGERVGANQGLAAAGDVNGDGYADVIVGSMGYDSASLVDAGRARVYLGSASGLSTTAAWTFEGSSAGALLGSAVAGAGDVDLDGFADVLVGAEGFGGGVGRVYLFKGSHTGLAPTPNWFADSPHPAQLSAPAFGTTLASAGDVDGDGFGDVLIAAPHNGSGQRVYLFRGCRKGLCDAPAWTYSNLEWGLQPYWTIQGAGAGDVNGDGFADVLIGAELEDFQAGHAYLYLGSSAGLATTPAWQSTGAANARLGRAVGRAGDVNHDGFADFAIGAPYEAGDQTAEGKLRVWFGAATGPAAAANLTRENVLANAAFGWSVAGNGDLDGDGFSDLAIGAPLSENPTLDEGRAYLFLGNAASGRPRRFAQRRLDDTAPIALGGSTAGVRAYRIAADAFSPAGRTRLQLEWENDLASVALDALDLDRGPITADTGVPSGGHSVVGVSERIFSLASLAQVHWRARITDRHPLFPRSPWFSICGNALSEAKVFVGR